MTVNVSCSNLTAKNRECCRNGAGGKIGGKQERVVVRQIAPRRSLSPQLGGFEK